MIKYFFIITTVLIFLMGCATLKISDIPQDEKLVSLEPLKTEIDYEIYQLRIDLNRQTTTETTTETTTTTDAQGYTTTTSTTVDVPYHYLGVDLGNGLFLDANNNLSINIVKLLGIENEENFRIVRKGRGFLGTDTIYEKNGNNVTIKGGGLFGGTIVVTLNENGASFKGGFLKSKQDIIESEDEIIYDPHGVFGGWSKARIIKTSNGAKIPKFWRNTEIVSTPDGIVSLGKNLVIIPQGKVLIFEFSGWFGFNKKYTLARTKDSLVYYDKNKKGIKIDIYKDGIVVARGAKKEFYEISF